jgi:hypothetical protein
MYKIFIRPRAALINGFRVGERMRRMPVFDTGHGTTLRLSPGKSYIITAAQADALRAQVDALSGYVIMVPLRGSEVAPAEFTESVPTDASVEESVEESVDEPVEQASARRRGRRSRAAKG